MIIENSEKATSHFIKNCKEFQAYSRNYLTTNLSSVSFSNNFLSVNSSTQPLLGPISWYNLKLPFPRSLFCPRLVLGLSPFILYSYPYALLLSSLCPWTVLGLSLCLHLVFYMSPPILFFIKRLWLKCNFTNTILGKRSILDQFWLPFLFEKKTLQIATFIILGKLEIKNSGFWLR